MRGKISDRRTKIISMTRTSRMLKKIINNPSLLTFLCLNMPSSATLHHQPRSTSPLLSMHSSTKQQSRAADISRLLDPSYFPTSASKGGYVSPQAYVDPYGDLHDPDYRHFPTSFPSSSSSPSKRHNNNNSPRPHWELTLDNENALDDSADEVDQEDFFFLSTSTAAHPQNHSRYSARRSSYNSSRRPRDSSFSTYSSNYYSPTGTISTLPTSYESDKTVLSRCSDADEKKSKNRRRLSKGDKEKEKEREESWVGSGPTSVVAAAETYYTGSLYRSRDLPPTREEAEDDQHVRLGSSTILAKGSIIRNKEVDFVPTCSQSLRRQWQALSLRFRFGVFRAQRKVMRRVHSFL